MMEGFLGYGANSCAMLLSEDRTRLWKAACILVDERGLLIRITDFVGQGAEKLGAKAVEYGSKLLGEGWEEKFRGLTEDALRRGHDLATIGMDATGEGESWAWFNKAVATASGAVGGFFGLPGLAIDIPVSTLLIMRSIAEIARANGEDISSDDCKQACLQVMASGGPGDEDDAAEVGYWSTRTMFTHTTIEMATRQAASKLSVALSEKVLAQLVPVAGAVAGGGLNYAFIDYYQQMARVHFTVRALERKYPHAEGSVRSCFDGLVRQARERRRPSKPAPDKEEAA